MKKILTVIYALSTIFLYFNCAFSSENISDKTLFEESYSKYFTCDNVNGWHQNFDLDEDKENNIYGVEITTFSANAVFPTNIYVIYYPKNNVFYKNYKIYLNKNSKSLFGRTSEPHEQYDPIVNSKVNGKNAFEINRRLFRYKHIHRKNDIGAWRKEKIYVIPASKGFYVLYYSAEESEYPKHVKEFEKLVKSFKGKM